MFTIFINKQAIDYLGRHFCNVFPSFINLREVNLPQWNLYLTNGVIFGKSVPVVYFEAQCFLGCFCYWDL